VHMLGADSMPYFADGATIVSVTVLLDDVQGEGMSAYISYKVTAQVSSGFSPEAIDLPPCSTAVKCIKRTSVRISLCPMQLSRKLEGLDSLSYSVIRRFSDFVWLRSQLRDDLPHLLIPALPEKQALGRLNNDFVDIRHRALQRFMARICAHPELSVSDPVRKFISLPAEAFAALRDAKKSTTAMVSHAAAAAGSGVVRALKSAATSISNVARGRGDSGAAGAGAVRGGRSAEDLSFGELEGYVLQQAPLVTALYNQAAAQAIKHREQAQLLLEYGAALRALGTADGGALGNALSQCGAAVWAGSTGAYEQAVAESELLVERIADAVRGIRAAKELLQERSRASAALADSLSVVEHLRARVTALAANPSAGAAADRARLEGELAGAQSAVTSARQYYDKVAASVIGEVERYRAGLRADFRSMLLDLAHCYARSAAKLAAAWEGITAQLAAAVTQEGATPLSALPAAMSAADAERAAAAAAAAEVSPAGGAGADAEGGADDSGYAAAGAGAPYTSVF